MEHTYLPPRQYRPKRNSIKYTEGMLYRLAEENGCEVIETTTYMLRDSDGNLLSQTAMPLSGACERLWDVENQRTRKSRRMHTIDDTLAQTSI